MALCKACDEPLILRIEEDDRDGNSLGGEGETVPDDLQLACGCHFHWECLMEEAATIAKSIQCPSCGSPLASEGAPILARYNNEGGLQEGLDILPSIEEESYLQDNPEARAARALHVMCSQGDVAGIVQLVREVDGEGGDVGALLRYQDPLTGMKSGLHLAVEKSHDEVIWLLLWLSSAAPVESFPVEARQTAESMELRRLDLSPDEDIRGLRDSRGRTAGAASGQGEGTTWAAILRTSSAAI